MPQLYLLIIIASVIDAELLDPARHSAAFSWVALVGVVRAEFLRARNFEYVTAARALGLSNLTIMFRHLLPNAMVATLTFLPFILNGSITTLTSLDFLGFGLPPGSPSLGELLPQGKDNLQAPWLGLTGFFVIAIMLSLLDLHRRGGARRLRPAQDLGVRQDARIAFAYTHGQARAISHGPAYANDERRMGSPALITGAFMFAEVAGGIAAGSLALLADAGHMLTDFASLSLAWFGFRLSRRPADWRRTYGFDRFRCWSPSPTGSRCSPSPPGSSTRLRAADDHAAGLGRHHGDRRRARPARQRRRVLAAARRRSRQSQRARRLVTCSAICSARWRRSLPAR